MSGTGSELWRRGAGELAALIRDGEASSREVVEAHLDRIAEVNPRVNAIVRVLAESALEAADRADRVRAEGASLGPLHGVPITVKENIDCEGTPTTRGIQFLADAVADRDAPVVEAMRAAGAIPIARTNLPDLGLRVTTESSLHGDTRNPWSPDRTAGGSSGGEGAALATGMSPLGLGNDLGGSLRNPAHCCGIASIKPSTGLVPAATVIPPEDEQISFQLMAVEGVMARRVDDVRRGLRVVARPHWRDPLSVPVDLDAAAVATPCRVALVPEPPGGSTDPGIAAVVRQAGDALADAGYDVVETLPPAYEEALELWALLLLPDVRAQLPLLDAVMGEGGRTFLHYADERFPELDAAQWSEVFVRRSTVARQWAAFLHETPLVVSPVWSQPPFPLGWDVASFEQGLATLELMRPVLPANLLGLPAAVVPGGLADDLPVGVQVLGARFTDLTCLAAAEVIEVATGPITPIDPVS